MTDPLPDGIRIEVHGKTTLHNGEVVSSKVTYNCDGCLWGHLLDKAGDSLWIDTQRVLRGLTTDDATTHANSEIPIMRAGSKPVTREDRVLVFMAAGMNREAAEFAADNPGVFDKLTAELMKSAD